MSEKIKVYYDDYVEFCNKLFKQLKANGDIPEDSFLRSISNKMMTLTLNYFVVDGILFNGKIDELDLDNIGNLGSEIGIKYISKAYRLLNVDEFEYEKNAFTLTDFNNDKVFGFTPEVEKILKEKYGV